MRPRILVFTIATAAVIGSAARPVVAQQSGAATRPARVLATYELRTSPRARAFPRVVTVADSAGTLVATATLPRGDEPLPMTVTPLETDLVLQAETPEGLLTLVLEKQNEGGARPLTSGRWMLGQSEGKLRGKVGG